MVPFRKQVQYSYEGKVATGRITITFASRLYTSENPNTDGQIMTRHEYTITGVNMAYEDKVLFSKVVVGEAALLAALPDQEKRLLKELEAYIKGLMTPTFEQKLKELGYK